MAKEKFIYIKNPGVTGDLHTKHHAKHGSKHDLSADMSQEVLEHLYENEGQRQIITKLPVEKKVQDSPDEKKAKAVK